jgi:hypothetical protein
MRAAFAFSAAVAAGVGALALKSGGAGVTGTTKVGS